MESSDARSHRPRRIAIGIAVVLAVIAWLLPRGHRGDSVPTGSQPPADAPAAPERGPSLIAAPMRPKPVVESSTAKPENAEPGSVVLSYVVEGVVREVGTNRAVPDARVVGTWSYGMMSGPLYQETSGDVAGGTDADGRLRIEVSTTPLVPIGRFRIESPGWHLVRWHVEDAPMDFTISAAPGATTRVALWVHRSFRLQGVVEDPAGRPIADVDVSFSVPSFMGTHTLVGFLQAKSGPDGRFDIGPFLEADAEGPDPGKRKETDPWLFVHFHREGSTVVGLDPPSVAPHERDHLRIVLGMGYVLAGVLVDRQGHPLADTTVAVEYGNDWNLRRGARTDADGRFRIERLPPGAAVLSARAFAHDAKARREITLTADDLAVRLVAEPIRLSKQPTTATVLGMTLAEVDDEIRAAYELPDHVHILILDPGPDADALGIGHLEKGYGLWMVGDKGVASMREAVEKLVEQWGGELGAAVGARVVYTFWNEGMSGTNTQYVRGSPERLAAAKAILERLPR